MIQANDKLGNPLYVGDFIAYAVRIGNSANQNIYRILEVRKDGSLKALRIGCPYVCKHSVLPYPAHSAVRLEPTDTLEELYYESSSN